ncbi:F-box/kelch-repeat protein At3g06240-like [Rhododendron vialii]|uniref:F-box/kelch-repeat protein At3g06240-like n=1 Tax=Rhododendron vialii TaxID=182163 RepID=UPI00265E35D7|nr:F-box/kelch-repeat protein At3g06240-like [Rhododendron vialii]XP_058187813.1 F-box/kelch-repeat protein At3g06240-like [Rhododendron vialii]
MAIGNLPEDLEMEILCRLPVKSLLRFKSVCKNWYALILNPSFISLHQDRATTVATAGNTDCLLVKRFVADDKGGMALSFVRYRKPVEDIDISSTGLDITRLRMLGPSNGVVCLTSLALNSPIVMCNPSMKEFKVLPQSCYKNTRYCNLGFGFDPSKNDYKVVKFAMRSTKFSNNSIAKRIEIYDLRTDSWREVDAGTPIELDFLCSEFVFASWNGDFYWYTDPHHGGDAAILAFSMTNELFKEMPVPKVCLLHQPHQRSVMRLSVLLDSLALVIYSQSERCFDIWVMDEEDGEMSWTKKFTKPFQGIERALGFRKNGEFLVESFSGLMMSYNLNTREIIEYQVDGPFPSFNLQLLPYTESLVSVKRHNELDGHIE